MLSDQLQAIAQWLEQHQQPKFRIKQICQAWYTQPNWEQATTLSKELRQELTDQFKWTSVLPVKVFTSPKDGTQKAILALSDGQRIETVFMPNARGHHTVCISSQVGCAMGCTFCATGTMGLKRNLTMDEIVDQVRFWRFQQSEPITNIVYMGMGEPLANYDNVKAAAEIFIHNMEFGKTHIVVSTVGFPVGLNKLLKDETFPDVRIAISLHAGTNATRSKIVPSNKQTSVEKIHDWVAQYLAKYGNRRHHLTIEYVMLLGVNDMPSEATALASLFIDVKHRIKINLIPWNQTNAKLQASSERNMFAFQTILEQAGFTTTIRYSKGLDIIAACGQLVIVQTPGPGVSTIK